MGEPQIDFLSADTEGGELLRKRFPVHSAVLNTTGTLNPKRLAISAVIRPGSCAGTLRCRSKMTFSLWI
jgi:hypothetical protein